MWEYVHVYVGESVGVRVRVRGGESAISMTPPCVQMRSLYRSSIFTVFGNLSITTCTPHVLQRTLQHILHSILQ